MAGIEPAYQEVKAPGLFQLSYIDMGGQERGKSASPARCFRSTKCLRACALVPRDGIEPSSEPVPKFRLNQPSCRDRFAREVSRSPWLNVKREIHMPSPAWSWWRGLNPRRRTYKNLALPLSYTSRFGWANCNSPTLLPGGVLLT